MDKLLGKKINNTRIVPVTLKIVILFTLFILASNFSTNYINLVYNRSAFMDYARQLLAKDLKNLFDFANTQYEIYEYSKDEEASKKSFEDKGIHELKNDKAIILAVKTNGAIFAQASRIKKYETFKDEDTLELLKKNLKNKNEEGFIPFEFNNEGYFGVYKYNKKWGIFIVRAEEYNEFYKESRKIFRDISIIIIIVTVACAVIGIFLLKYILRFIGVISMNLLKMIQNQKMGLIDLKDAPNDDITFLGVAFNSLSNTIDNLVTIFKKFANREVAMKAYQEREIRLEGTMRELTILFSDIKSFTFITETLGSDIIKLINMHYDKAIKEIEKFDGVVGSIIGDAILAMFGVVDQHSKSGNKSYDAIIASYQIQDVCLSLRMIMHKRKEEIVKKNGALTPEEEKIYKACLLEIGVGLDGGEVFYGNIGSTIRMTNTVIGDNVNSASRLEGLTRVYKVPVVCSEYVKNDVEKMKGHNKIHFVELDRVQVKGKTLGKTVYWPILNENYDKNVKNQVAIFEEGLQYYYSGKWKKAYKYFQKCKLPLAEVFRDRTKNATCPKRWNGVWTMTTK